MRPASERITKVDGSSANTWDIRPHAGIGALHFGQARADVLALLGAPSATPKEFPFATTETDTFGALGLHVNYDPAYRIESVDAVAPSTVSLRGVPFLGRRVDDVLCEMAAQGYWCNCSSALVFGGRSKSTFHDVGILISEERGVVNCITVFPREYYDSSNPDSPASRFCAAYEAWMRWNAILEDAHNG